MPGKGGLKSMKISQNFGKKKKKNNNKEKNVFLIEAKGFKAKLSL